MTTTIVCGNDYELARSARALRRAKFAVSAPAFPPRAATAFPKGSRVLVLGHGSPTAIYWKHQSGKETEWMGTPIAAPLRADRIYFYACDAGQVFGRQSALGLCISHENKVPLPVDDYAPLVLWYLRLVVQRLEDNVFAPGEAKAWLRSQVDEKLAELADAAEERRTVRQRRAVGEKRGLSDSEVACRVGVLMKLRVSLR